MISINLKSEIYEADKRFLTPIFIDGISNLCSNIRYLKDSVLCCIKHIWCQNVVHLTCYNDLLDETNCHIIHAFDLETHLLLYRFSSKTLQFGAKS